MSEPVTVQSRAQGVVWAGDLLRALEVGGEPALRATARAMGWEERLGPARGDAGLEIPMPKMTATEGDQGDVPADGAEPLPPVLFWMPTELQVFSDAVPEVTERPFSLAELRSRTYGRQPQLPELVPWSRLRSRLLPFLQSKAPGSRLDVRRLLKIWCRAEPLRDLPRLRSAMPSARMIVLIDRSSHLQPFYDDQDALVRTLRQQLGARCLHVERWPNGIEPLEEWAIRPDAGDPVLALTDLGAYSGHQVALAWQGLARDLARLRVDRLALLPCPRDRWHHAPAGEWCALEWEVPHRPGAAVRPTDAGEIRSRGDQLEEIVAPFLDVKPGMMRVIRRACTGRSFDAGTEHDVSRRRAAAQPTDDPVPVELSNWAEAVGVAGHDVVRLAREWHRALPPEVWAEEVLAIGVDAGCPDWLVDGELETAKNLLRRVSVNLRRGKEAGDVLFESLASWLQDFGPRRTRVWLDPELGPLLRASLESIGHEAEARQTLQPAPVRKGEGGLPTTLVSAAQAYQFGDRVEFCGVGFPSSRRGSWLASLRVGSKIGFGASRGAPFASEQPDLSTVFSSPLPHGRRMVWRSDLEELVVELLPRPDWARAMGRDRFGLWAEFAVEEVVQRMRYIPPGRFLMGSPEAEAGRRDDEGPAHEVQLTSGFWLGETLCTQALWEVVTKDNPSEFRSPNRPVERVSCADIEGVFLKKLADRGFEGRLPTEAEWEYACRGFVDAATYRGDLEISDGVAAPQLESIAWYGANCGTDFDLDNGQQLEWLDAPYDKIIGGTHPVAGKDPNPLGLFDMLGNVWEWCSDGKRDYAPGWVIDPEGPLGGASRVVRGGSWSDPAHFVRAAFRYSYAPGNRCDSLGFRLARGQESAPSQGGGAGSHDRVRRDAGEVAGEGGVNQGV